MPPKKAIDVSKPVTGDEGTPAKDQPLREGVNIEDLNLPKSIVTRLAKGVLPPNTQIQGNAMLAMTKSATSSKIRVHQSARRAVLIETPRGNEIAIQEGRKTLASRDIISALKALEFPDWEERLQAELDSENLGPAHVLSEYTEIQTDKRLNYRKKVADNKVGTAEGAQAAEGEDGNNDLGEGGSHQDRDGQPAAKKARLELGATSGMDESVMIQEGDQMGEHTADESGEDDENPADEAEDDEDENEEDHEERLEVEDQLEDIEPQEAEDEALDNGEDSD
ncbi:DNA polymerase epsilon subunit D [Lachnellula occidentalis]|uniref:DNA polymerase epsilon subunit D n=1 Tax=Lachnellula occidentalis TaxID=215460 RepID=A0A8H8RNL2_9HELO|nr:DNA polymerase epsilon subunit D [Lachnellula occidentalis]